MKELCGHPTPKGPCTMQKGHNTEWHRHRKYDSVKWNIKEKANSTILESGVGRVPLNYAITRQLDNHDKLVVIVERDGH